MSQRWWTYWAPPKTWRGRVPIWRSKKSREGLLDHVADLERSPFRTRRILMRGERPCESSPGRSTVALMPSPVTRQLLEERDHPE